MRFRAKINRNVNHTFFLFYAIFYIAPLILSKVWFVSYSSTFTMTTGWIWLDVLIFIFPFLIFLFDGLIPSFRLRASWHFSFIMDNQLFISIFLILFLVIASDFSLKYSIDFRHKYSYSDLGFKGYLLIFLRTYFRIYVYYCLFLLLNSIDLGQFRKCILLLVSISFFLSSISSFDSLYIFISLSISLGLGKSIFETFKNRGNSLKKKIITSLLIPLITLSILYIGLANKVGTSETTSLFTDTKKTVWLTQYFSKRLSVHYISFRNSADSFFEDPFFASEGIVGTVKNTGLRLCLLCGVNCGNKPKVWSVNRVNYFIIFKHSTISSDTGASPGVMAMLFYIPIFPFSIIIVVSYLVFVLRRFNLAVGNTNKVSILVKVVLTFLFMSFFENLIAYINIFDPPFFYLFFFWVATGTIDKKQRLFKT